MPASDLSRDPILMHADETLEDLQRSGFRMLQKKGGFRFGTDSVLLAAYAASFYPHAHAARGVIRIADLGAGCGAVSLLLAARLPQANIVGLEIDPVSAEVFQRNRRLNQLEDRLQVIRGDIRDLAAGTPRTALMDSASFDLVVSNPPYGRMEGHSLTPGPDGHNGPDGPDRQGGHGPTGRQAKEELSVNLAEVFQAARHLLRPRGRLILVHRTGRLPEIMAGLPENGLTPKTMRLVQTLQNKTSAIVLVSAVRQGIPGGFTAEPLIVYSQPGIYSAEVAAWYGWEKPLAASERYRDIQIVENEQDFRRL